MQNKVAVVTGATGMLALALIRKLISEDYLVYAVIRPNSRRASNIPNDERIKVVECDLADIAALPSMIDGGADIFFHFAWDATYGGARDNMPLQIGNISSAVAAAEAASALGCSVFLGAGSQAEFGRHETKLSPSTKENPESGYGIAKLCAGQMTRAVCKKYGIKHIWCRIFSTYGPYDSENTMVTSGIIKLLRGERAQYTKAEQLWDYLHCDDAAEAFYLAATRGTDGAVYCVGGGKTRRLYEYIYAIRDAVDPALPIGIGELEYYDKQVMYLCADITSLTEDTGFLPKISFEEGIKSTVEWIKSRGCKEQ